MTLEEKVGQMTQAERAEVTKDPTQLATLGLGSPAVGRRLGADAQHAGGVGRHGRRLPARRAASRLHIPIIYGVDSVHGHGNLYGATVFPHNIGLGATRDPGLVEEVEHITADETRASGPQWAFAPCICAARDDRWGRTYESFSEDPGLVIRMETAIDGFQGDGRGDLAHRDRVLATAKHYAGDGDTVYGTGNGDYTIDQGITITDREDFWRNDLRQYVPAVQRARRRHASCRRTPAWTGPRTGSATPSTCTATASSSPTR